MDDEALRRQLLTGLEYCHLHASWVTPLEEALSGLTAEQATRRSDQDSKSIWEIVLHLTVWNENIVERVQSGEPVRPREDWPGPPEVADEAAWESAKGRLRDSLALVRRLIETEPMAKLAGPPYGLADLLCRFTHTAYHIGQITKMRA